MLGIVTSILLELLGKPLDGGLVALLASVEFVELLCHGIYKEVVVVGVVQVDPVVLVALLIVGLGVHLALERWVE